MTFFTPRSCSKTASRHQKQPPASVANCVLMPSFSPGCQADGVGQAAEEGSEVHALRGQLVIVVETLFKRRDGTRRIVLGFPCHASHELGVNPHRGRCSVSGI